MIVRSNKSEMHDPGIEPMPNLIVRVRVLGSGFGLVLVIVRKMKRVWNAVLHLVIATTGVEPLGLG